MNNNLLYDEKMNYNELYEMISFLTSIKNTRIFKLIKKHLLLYFPKYYNKHMEEMGVYGRTGFVRDIYQWHKKSKGKQCAIVCGYAGSGKTTIIRYFEESPQMRNHYKVITKSDDMPQRESIKKNMILFFDYAIEMREEIQQLYKSLDSNQKISLILLERDKTEYAFKQELGAEIEIKIFNINEDAPLTESDLSQIINYHYRHRFDELKKEMICVNGFDYPQNLEKYVDILVQKVDSKFRRPIFAVFLGNMLREGKPFNLAAIEDQDYLCEKYWVTVKSQKKYEKYKKLKKMQGSLIEKDTINILIEQSKIPILIASVLEIKIRISFAGNNIKWDAISENFYKNEFEGLMDLFEEKFCKLTEGQLNFFLGLESEKENDTYYGAKSGIVETESQFDLLIAWLFRNCIHDEKIKRPFLTEAINCFSPNIKKYFLKKCFRYTEDYENDDTCILDYLNNYEDFYKNWPIEQYLLTIKDMIISYTDEEKNEIKEAKKGNIIKICKTAQKSLDNESWNVLKKNIEIWLKESLGENELILWQKFLDNLNFVSSQEVLTK